MPENCANIIDLLIEQRHNQGMTQKELAQAACLTQSVIARLESKKATPPLLAVIWRLYPLQDKNKPAPELVTLERVFLYSFSFQSANSLPIRKP